MLLLCIQALFISQPLYLSVYVSQSVVVSGDQITLDAYLFNDSTATVLETITIVAPVGFVPLTPQMITSAVAPHAVLELHARYRVIAKPGVANFFARGGKQTVLLALSVCCVEAPRAMFHVHVPLIRH